MHRRRTPSFSSQHNFFPNSINSQEGLSQMALGPVLPAAKPSKQGADEAKTMSNNGTRVGNIGRDVTDSSQSYAFVLFKWKEEAATAAKGFLWEDNPSRSNFIDQFVLIIYLSTYFYLLFLYGNSICEFVEQTILG